MKDKSKDDTEWISNIFKTIFELTPIDSLKRYPTHDAIGIFNSPLVYLGDLDTDQTYLLESYLGKLVRDNQFHILILTDNDSLYHLEDYTDRPFFILEPGIDQSSINPFQPGKIPVPVQIAAIIDIFRHVEPHLSPASDLILRLHLWDLFNQKRNFDINDLICTLEEYPSPSVSRNHISRELLDIIRPLTNLNISQLFLAEYDNVTLENLQSKNVIINVHNLSSTLAKGLFYNSTLWRIWLHSYLNPAKKPHKHITLMDSMHLASPTIVNKFVNPILEPLNSNNPQWLKTNLMLLCSQIDDVPWGVWENLHNLIIQKVDEPDINTVAHKIGMDAIKLRQILHDGLAVFKYENLQAFAVELKYI